jgi:DNA-binding LacI/PurR family transcriptional regulator
VVRQPAEEVGAAAFKLLLSYINARNKDDRADCPEKAQIRLPLTYVERASVAPPAKTVRPV